MKKVMAIFGVVLMGSLILSSCGSKDKKNDAGASVKPKSTAIKGDLGDYFQVVDKEYTLQKQGGPISESWLISVEVKRTDKDFAFPADNINPFGTNGGEDYHVGFGIELLGDAGPVDVKQATEGGMGGPYSSEDVTGLMKLKKGESGFIRWSISKAEGIKSFQLTSALQKEEHQSSSSSSSAASGDCEQFCSDYEAFADEYVAVIKKYKANPSDLSLLTEYNDVLQKAASMEESAKDCRADATVASRISKAIEKIAKAAM